MIYDDAAGQVPAEDEELGAGDHHRPHTNQSLDGGSLQAYVKGAVDPAKPAAINVIDFGADPDRSTWESVAQLSGRSYQNLTTSDSPDLTTAVNTFLG